METLPWAVTTKLRLHFLWYAGGPPLCQRKQSVGKIFKQTMEIGIGHAAGMSYGVEVCRSCTAKVRARNV